MAANNITDRFTGDTGSDADDLNECGFTVAEEITIEETANMKPAAATARKEIFLCLPNEEALAALKTLLNVPRVQVEVVGGILRHDIR